MKKTTTAKMALALLLGGWAISANAQNVIEEGVAFKPAADTVYEFTPSIDGSLTISVNSYAYFMYMQNWDFLLYSSANHSEDSGIPNSGYNEIASDVTDYNYQNIEAGKTYYFYTNIYEGVDCTFSMKEYAGEGVAKVTPSTNNLFNYVVLQEVQIFGTSNIESIGKVSVSYGSTTVDLDSSVYTVGINGGGGSFFIQITGLEFQKLVASIANSGADSFTIIVEDVKTTGGEVVVNDSGEESVKVDNGTVSVTYNVSPAAQYLAESSSWPSPFYSSWQENDPLGMATLSFDQEIASVGEVTLMMGYFTEGMISEMDSYDLTDKTKVNGKDVVIDFTGVLRTANVRQITVIVQNVRSTNGMTANMGSSPLNLSSTLFEYIDFANEAAPENPDIPDDPDQPDTPDTPKYMEHLATQVNSEITGFDAAIELLWPETVTIVDAETLEIPVYKGVDLIGNLTAPFINLGKEGDNQPAIPSTRVETGESGNIMFLLIGASGLIEQPGLYTLRLPEGMVENAEGAINREQMLAVIYVTPAEGVVTPEAATTFEADEDVIITIAFDGEIVEENYSEDAPVIITDYADFNEFLNWTPDVLYIEGNAIVINLGTELEPGIYYLSLREGVVLVDGVVNAAIDDYMFSVAEGATDSIETIGDENGIKEIYNLHGVKMNENNVGKGIYIINGKKVIIK